MTRKRMIFPLLLVLAVAALIAAPAYAQVEIVDLGYQARPLNPGRGTVPTCEVGKQPTALDEGAVVMKVRITDKDYPADDRSDVVIKDIQVNDLGNTKVEIIKGIAFLDKDNRCIGGVFDIRNKGGWGSWYSKQYSDGLFWTIPDDGTQILQVVVWLTTSDILADYDQGEDTLPNRLQLQLTLKYKEQTTSLPLLEKTSDPIDDLKDELIWNGGFERAEDNRYNGGVLPIWGRGIVQEFTLCDDDALPTRPSIVEVWVNNFGTADRHDLSAISLYVKGENTPIASVQIFPDMPTPFTPGTPFPITPNSADANKQTFEKVHGKASTFAYAIPDDSCVTFQIGVVVSPNAFPGHTIEFHTTIYAEEPYQTGRSTDGAWIDDTVAPEVSDGLPELIGESPGYLVSVVSHSDIKIASGARGAIVLRWDSANPEHGLGSLQGTISWDPKLLDPIDDPLDATDDKGAFELFVREDGKPAEDLSEGYTLEWASIDHKLGKAEFNLIYNLTGDEEAPPPVVHGTFLKLWVKGLGSPGKHCPVNFEVSLAEEVHWEWPDGHQVMNDVTADTYVAQAKALLVVLGDIDGDGKVTIHDATLLARHLVGLITLSQEELLIANINQDKKTDSADVVGIARAAITVDRASIGGAALTEALAQAVGLKVASISLASRGSTITLQVDGQGIAGAKLEVFDLAGRRLFDSGFAAGNTLEWNLLGSRGKLVANGVYLYAVTVKGYAGELMTTPVRKLAILR
jgi:hypothetical protein